MIELLLTVGHLSAMAPFKDSLDQVAKSFLVKSYRLTKSSIYIYIGGLGCKNDLSNLEGQWVKRSLMTLCSPPSVSLFKSPEPSNNIIDK